MLIRTQYLNQLIRSKDLNLIKVITGVRRCGKSTLLLQYKDYLISQGIIEKNIIYMNFESAAWYSNEYSPQQATGYLPKAMLFLLLKFQI